MHQPSIAIIGAGPGGLTLARILHLRGLQAIVFEGDVFSSARPQGWSLDMHPETGQFAIERAGLTAEFQRIARYEDQEMCVYDKHGTLRLADTDVTGKRPARGGPRTAPADAAGFASAGHRPVGSQTECRPSAK